MSWSNALATCQNMGGSLVSISSSAEQRFVGDLVNSRGDFWLGLFTHIVGQHNASNVCFETQIQTTSVK